MCDWMIKVVANWCTDIFNESGTIYQIGTLLRIKQVRELYDIYHIMKVRYELNALTFSVVRWQGSIMMWDRCWQD